MFEIKPRGDTTESYWSHVTIGAPADFGVERHRVEVKYRLLTQPEVDDALAVADDGALEDVVPVVRFLEGVIVDWRGFVRATASGKEPIECTPEAIAEVCELIHVRSALLDGFFASVTARASTARAKRHRKNS